MVYNNEINLEEEQIESPYPGDMIPPVNETTTLLQQTNPQPVIAQIENTLRGYEWDSEKEQWEAKYDPLMNDLGVRKIITRLNGIVNTNCILSNLSERDVQTITLAVAHSITMDICANYKLYDIKKSDFDLIIESCAFMCFFSLKRGLGEGERRFLKTAYQSRETVMRNPDQPKSGWVPFFKGGKR